MCSRCLYCEGSKVEILNKFFAIFGKTGLIWFSFKFDEETLSEICDYSSETNFAALFIILFPFIPLCTVRRFSTNSEIIK